MMSSDDDVLKHLPKVNQTSSQDDTSDKKQPQGEEDNSSIIPQPTSNVGAPGEASDTDLIEKEWVERAKQIVEHTKDDPHEQQKALSRMKADYMKKRYNRDIKVSNE